MHIYILPPCSTTAARVLNPVGMDAQFGRSRCAISRGILSKYRFAISKVGLMVCNILLQYIIKMIHIGLLFGSVYVLFFMCTCYTD